MIEQIIYEYLKDHLEYPVFAEMPAIPSEEFNKLPERFVTFERVGGSEPEHIMYAGIAVQSYGSSIYECAELDLVVRNVMSGLIELNNISSCRLSSSYNHTDTRTNRHRYQSTFDIYYTDY